VLLLFGGTNQSPETAWGMGKVRIVLTLFEWNISREQTFQILRKCSGDCIGKEIGTQQLTAPPDMICNEEQIAFKSIEK
jgi:hypothetical protein